MRDVVISILVPASLNYPLLPLPFSNTKTMKDFARINADGYIAPKKNASVTRH